jgi:hypothetical protein
METTKTQGENAAEQRWQEFAYAHIDSGWFDCDRTRTLHAMRTLCERMPKEAKDELPSGIIVFAPSGNVCGEARPLYTPEGPERHDHFIYLAPCLERRPQDSVDATVAHEFAHVLLGHGEVVDPDDPLRQEREADLLIQKWGYPPTNSCDWMKSGKKPRGRVVTP